MGLIALLFLGILLNACGENEPPLLMSPDTNDDWAAWPPEPGNAGFRLIWTVEGVPPSVELCDEVDLAHVRLFLVHPVADFETWTAPDLTSDCEQGEIVRTSAVGLAAGRYRYGVELLHGDGDPFQQYPAGEMLLASNEITTIGTINVTQAVPNDGG